MLRGAVPDDRVEALAAEMATNDRKDIRVHLRRYYDYLHRHGTLAPRLCKSGVQAEVVFGEHDEVGLTPGERSTLESCPTIRLHVAPDAGHMLINQQPDWIAELIVGAVARYTDQTRQDARSRTARSTLR
jgi:pimeloyl-ACP methyl ester carboxylesterase